VYLESEAPALKPISCCDPAQQNCCYDKQRDLPEVAEPMMEAPANLRLPQVIWQERHNLISTPKKALPNYVVAPRSERPPGGCCQELSFRQSWLI
jgi:hypothetical protein